MYNIICRERERGERQRKRERENAFCDFKKLSALLFCFMPHSFSLSLNTCNQCHFVFVHILFPAQLTRFIDKLRCFPFQFNAAPEKHQIKLDFRNRFNIEPSPTCEYDFIEVKT